MNQPSDTTFDDPFDPQALLQWYLEMGVDECISTESIDRYAQTAEMAAKRASAQKTPPPAQSNPQAPMTSAPAAPPPSAPQVQATDAVVQAAVTSARNASNVDELHKAVLAFDGCPLKKTAMNTVFADGNPHADVMIIGDAPGTDEDRQGKPFCGDQGLLLDKMLHSCGVLTEVEDRSRVYMTNVVFWRPPGNRNPTQSEIAVCLPFVERHIELVNPKVIILLGEAAAKAVLGRHDGFSKLRGRWFEHATPGLSAPVPVTAHFHPAYLLRSPAQKRRAWNDLLNLSKKLETL